MDRQIWLCFQAKLKNHIHEPNSPELVHFLFTPLAVIVDAARDCGRAGTGPSLASRVVSPLLTRDALELLANCCTSKESDLWHSLGDPWVVPRDLWKGYETETYQPVFSDGWAPDCSTGSDDQMMPQQPHPRRRSQEEVRSTALCSLWQKGSKSLLVLRASPGKGTVSLGALVQA